MKLLPITKIIIIIRSGLTIKQNKHELRASMEGVSLIMVYYGFYFAVA